MQEIDEVKVSDRKQKIRRAMLAFFLVMIILAFLSNTISNLSLPRIETEWPSRGSIIKEIEMDGKTEAKETYHFYAPSNLRVLEVNVRTGEQVRKGQRMLTLDTGDIQKQLLDETDRYEQKKITLSMMQQKSSSSLAEYDEAIESAQIQRDRAKADYERIRVLVEQGSETEGNLQAAQRKLNDAEREHKKAINNRSDAILSNQSETEKNEMEIQSLLYDMEIQKRGIEQLQEQLKACEATAPFDGIISGISFREGETADPSQPLYSLLNISKGYCFVGLLDNDTAEEIKPGDEAEITMDGFEFQKITGKVVEIRNSRENPGEQKEVELEVSFEPLTEGQKGEVKFEKRSGTYEFLVSNSAIGQDSNGCFVYVPEEKKSYLGNEIFARVVRVTIGESDDKKTAIIQGLNKEDRVIMNSDKPLADGMRVIRQQ